MRFSIKLFIDDDAELLINNKRVAYISSVSNYFHFFQTSARFNLRTIILTTTNNRRYENSTGMLYCITSLVLL